MKRVAAFTLGLVVFSFGLFGVVHAATPKQDCDNNAIIYCGTSSPSDFISTVRKNYSGNNHSDLQSIYAHEFAAGQSLSSSQYNNFAKNALTGTVYKDGHIAVNGKTVANNVKVLGRLASYAGAGYTTYSLNGQTYYGGLVSKVYANTTGLPAYVLLDDNDNMIFAVLASGDNPLFGNVVKTSASCKSLQKTAVNAQPNTYKFKAAVNLSGNARLVKYVYDFGDGSAQTITGNFGQALTHTYTSPGEFTATATPYISLVTNDNYQLPASANCTQSINVQTSSYSCVQLTGSILDKSSNIYHLSVTGAYGKGITPKSASFSFGDGKSQTLPMSGTTATVDHDYPDNGQIFTSTVTLHFKVGDSEGSASSQACQVKINTAPPACQALSGAITNHDTYEVEFTAKADLNGTNLTGMDINFGDGNTQYVSSSVPDAISVKHTYGGSATYNATATLHFTANGKNVTALPCRAVVSPNSVTPACKPGVPVGSAKCMPCKYDVSLNSDDPKCSAAVIGARNFMTSWPGKLIALVVIAALVYFLIWRHKSYRHR